MTRFGRESDLRGMLKAGRDESFTPDFLAMKEVVADSPGVYETQGGGRVENRLRVR